MNINKAWFFIIDFLVAFLLYIYITLEITYCKVFTSNLYVAMHGDDFCWTIYFKAFIIWLVFTILLGNTYHLLKNNNQAGNFNPSIRREGFVFIILTLSLFVYIILITAQSYVK